MFHRMAGDGDAALALCGARPTSPDALTTDAALVDCPACQRLARERSDSDEETDA